MDNGERAGASELAAGWLGRLRSSLAGYAGVALENIDREFPAYISSTMTAPGDFPHRPRDRNPVFYGSFDWHSSVEMHWLLVRLLRVTPDAVPSAEIRKALRGHLERVALALTGERPLPEATAEADGAAPEGGQAAPQGGQVLPEELHP